MAFKSILVGVAKRSGAFALTRHCLRNRLRILAYHGVDQGDPVLNFDGLQVPPDLFREQMAILEAKYKVLPLAELLEAMRSGEPVEPHAVAITFDDGYRNNLTKAAPVLKQFGFHATFFVTTGFIDGTQRPWWYDVRAAIARCRKDEIEGLAGTGMSVRLAEDKKAAVLACERELKKLSAYERTEKVAALCAACGVEQPSIPYPMMGPDEVKALADDGFDVGPHTVSHVAVSRETRETVEEEITRSIDRVTEITGRPPVCYSYPYGQPGDVADIGDLLRSRGLKGALTTISGTNRIQDDPFSLRRLNVGAGHDADSFQALVSGFPMRT